MASGEPISPFRQRLRATVDWVGQPGGAPIDAWRRRILAAVLLGCCVFGGLAYAVGGSIAWISGQRKVVVLDTIIYVGVLTLTLRPSLSYRVRAGLVALIPLILGVYFLWFFGFMAAGFPWLLTFPVLASVLFGVRASVAALALTALVLLGIGLAIPSGLLPWTAGVTNPGLMWAVSASSVLMIDLLLALSVGYLFEGLGNEVVARRAAEMEADRRQRLAALGTITGGIAHDFNNLLQPIVSDTEHAQRVLADGGDPSQQLIDILQTSDRARALVRRILGFARPPQGVRDVIELGAVVTESERLLPALLPGHITLAVELADSVFVAAEASELQQVLLNLVNNAAQAMPKGGVVTLRVDSYEQVHLHMREDLAGTPLAGMPSIARLLVCDTGIGMDGATISRIFEPFYTTKGPQRGSGLGLATVHATVTALGGLVRARSTLGHGTRMEVLLPAMPAPIMSVRATPKEAIPVITPHREDTKVASPSPVLVFVVDDEPAVLAGTTRLMERFGFNVHAFSAPEHAVAAIAAECPALVLTDLAMPDMTGWEVAAATHAACPDVPVIVMTGHMDAHDEDLSLRPGVCAVLPKPFTSAELQHAISERVILPVSRSS
ncbi:MAG: response regulator [Gemmatimonadaceae bacterium]|nr:response regulator [Gemmatimonadaceae bacterium]